MSCVCVCVCVASHSWALSHVIISIIVIILFHLLFEGGEWNEDDFVSLHHHTGSEAPAPGDKSEFEYFEYTDQPETTPLKESAKKSTLTGVCRVSLPPFGGPFYLSYRRTFTSIADKTLADVKPGEELKESDAVVTRLNKVMAKSEVFEVSFQVQPQWKGTGTNVKCRHLQKSRDFMNILNDSSSSPISKEFDNLTYLVEDLQSINVISLSIKLNPLSDIVAHNSDSHFDGFSRVSAWISSDGDSINKERIISVEADCCGKLSYLHMTLPNFPSSYALLMNKTVGQVTTEENKYGSKFNSSVVIRIPYHSTGGSPESIKVREPPLSTELSAGGLECSFCCNALTVKGAIQHLNLLPSGKFDHVSNKEITKDLSYS
jgi:hypothetical protein